MNTKDQNQKNEILTSANGHMKESQEFKPRIDLLDPEFIERMGLRMEMGARKYAENNWRNCTDKEIYKASAMRHIFQWMAGKEDEDHAAAAAVNISFYEYLKKHQ